MERNTDHSCIVKAGLFTPNSALARQNLEGLPKDGIQIDPVDVRLCDH